MRNKFIAQDGCIVDKLHPVDSWNQKQYDKCRLQADLAQYQYATYLFIIFNRKDRF